MAAQKEWVTKAEHDKLFAEYESVLAFLSELPAASLDLPRCLSLDLIEVRFVRTLMEDLTENKTATMQARFESIDEVKLQGLLPSEEVGSWQVELIKSGLLMILEDASDLQLLWSRLFCFLGAFPRDMQAATTFTVPDAIKVHLVNMCVAFDKEIHLSDPTRANDKMLAIVSSQDDICKILTVMGTGIKFLNMV